MRQAERSYLTGFGNHHESEAIEGALPIGRSNPQRPPFGLYAEKFSHTAFTVSRALNQRSWFYRIRPSVRHGPFVQVEMPLLCTSPGNMPAVPAQQLRWDPPPALEGSSDFVEGLRTIVVNGNADTHQGMGIHLYQANRSMDGKYFFDADGELLIIPQSGRLEVATEFGILEVEPLQIALIPRGIKFKVDLLDSSATGYVAENYGHPFVLPERGLVGSDGFANDRDFEAPVACFEDRDGDFELWCKLGGNIFRAPIGHSPLDVVAWHGNCAPYRYDLRRFNTMGTVSYDHPDPSIYTVLTSLSDTPGVANVDFVIFPPRWMVAEDTFRPPWFHRNMMSEFMGLIDGVYDAKPEGFMPGGASLHNCMLPHGPDAASHDKAVAADLKPVRMADTMAFMLESRYLMHPTQWALSDPGPQEEYPAAWEGLDKKFPGSGS